MSGSQPDFDLQSHSTHSDGHLPPADVVSRAADAGIRVLALSDHDTVAGLDEALAAGARHGVRIVPAVELSSVDPAGEDLHILGYGIDHRDHRFAAALARFREDRVGRIARMADAMEDLGWHVDRRHLEGRAAPGRPHLAAAVHGHPANAARVVAEALGTSTDLLVAYLIPGAPGFRGRSMPTVPEAIEAIHASGGVAVWAHPYWDLDGDGEVEACLRRFAAAGLDGVEAFYVAHDEAQTRRLVGWAEDLGLLTTGSADFHGPDHPRFHTFGAFELHGLTPTFDLISAAPTHVP